MPSRHAISIFLKWPGAHRAAAALSIAVSIVYGAHHIVISQQLAAQNREYHPIVVNEDEALFTGPKAHAAEMGEIIVGDFNLAEYRDTRIYVLPFLSPLIMGNLARVTGSIERAFIAGDFIFPPIIFLLFYAMILLLSRHRLLSLFGASLFIFLPQLLTAFPPATRYLQALLLGFAAKGSSLYFSRVEDPQLTVPLYLGAIMFILLIFQGRKEKWVIAGGSVMYGLLFYSYFYYWVWITLALGIGIALAWYTRSADLRNRLIACMGLGLLISIPHWINAYYVSNLPQYPDIFDRLRPEVGRTLNLEAIPVFQYFVHAGLIAAAWFLSSNLETEFPLGNSVSKSAAQPKMISRGTALFFTSFLAPLYIAYNMQLVTGFNVHPDHWPKTAMPLVNTAFLVIGLASSRRYARHLQIRRLFAPAAILALFLIYKASVTEIFLVRFASLLLLAAAALGLGLIWLVRRCPLLNASRTFVALGALAVALLFAKGIFTQHRFISRNAAKTIPEAEYKSYQWLSANTPPYSVVATPSFTTANRIQLYTRNRLFLPNGYNTIAGDEELWQRLRLTNALFGTSTTTYRSYLEGRSDLGGGGEDDPPGDNLYFAFKPELDRLAVYYLFHMKYLDASPGGAFRSASPLLLPSAIVEREMEQYQNGKHAGSLPYRLDYLYYGPREQRLVPTASRLSEYEKAYDADGIVIYRYRP